MIFSGRLERGKKNGGRTVTLEWEKFSAYLYHLVENHPFVDGNKRVGAMAALIFLDINDIDFDAPEELFTGMVLKVANGKMLKAEITLFLREYSHSR